jgi:hypothetical protein
VERKPPLKTEGRKDRGKEGERASGRAGREREREKETVLQSGSM